MADIQERLDALASFPFEDNQRNIEASTLSINIASVSESNFIDRNAYDSKFVPEMYTISKMRDILERGEYFVNIIYTYRSCSKALPQAKNSDEATFKEELNSKTFEVLEPEIQKVKDLYQFQKDTIQFFCEQVKNQVTEEKKAEVTPEGVLWHMIKIIDLLALLDALLNMKACLVTDFSFYKRAIGFLKPNDSQQDKLLAEQGLFLAKQNRITEHFKNEIKEIKGFDEFLVLLVNMCATYIENEKYVLLPSDKHSLLRVIPYGLFLMDGREGNFINIFKNKKINVKRFSNLFKKYPIVTLYGDMQIKLDNMIKSAPNYIQGSWPIAETEKLAKEYEIIHHLPTIRVQHTEYMGKLNTILNMIKIDEPECDEDTDFSLEVTNIILDGLSLISTWTSKVLQQSAWKYFKPNIPEDGEMVENSYENVVKRNYSKEECFALVEIIGLIKGLSNIIIKEDGILTPYIRTCIHHEIQHFTQITIGELLAYATKKKRPFRVDLTQIRTLAFDPVDGGCVIDDSFFKNKKKLNDVQIKTRSVGPSSTQLELLRTSVYYLFSNRNNGKKTPFEKDISKESLKSLEEFYGRSFNYFYLMNVKSCILSMIDLGDLWYREFYLELTKTLQFPIEWSLPWILTDTILESDLDYDNNNISMLEFILYPLDIYNDAANRALSNLHQQFLYDEIEAEVNLCFDQLIFKLSNSIYKQFKIQASNIILEDNFKSSLEQIFSTLIPVINTQNQSSSSSSSLLNNTSQPQGHDNMTSSSSANCFSNSSSIINGYLKFHFPYSKFHVLLSQRHYQLLGRFFNLNHLISQRINNLLRKNIDNAISRFEAKNLSSIIELESQLHVIQLTHFLLSNYFNQLDCYDSLFNEINGNINFVSYHSRIAFHIISECASDFFAHYNFNSTTNRFTRCIIEFGESVQRDSQPSAQSFLLYGDRKLTAAYHAYHQNFSKIFSLQHAKSLLYCLGKNNLSLVIDEILTFLNLKIENVLAPYVSELFNAMPPNSKCPLYDYKLSGSIGYFSGKLIDIIQYPPLQSDVFQHFKELGNAIAFLHLLDLALEHASNDRIIISSSYIDKTNPNSPSSSASSSSSSSSSSSDYFNRANCFLDFLSSNSNQESSSSFSHYFNNSTNSSFKDICFSSLRSNLNSIQSDISKPLNQSLFVSCLDQIYSFINAVRDEWDLQNPEEGAVIPVESSREFYRLFSALKYIYCLPLERGQGEYDCFDLFGDGFFWGGLTIIHFLGQRKRFLAFDFADHLLNVADVYPPEPSEKTCVSFLQNASRVKNLSCQIFNLLNNFIAEYQPFIVQIHPPVDDSDSSQFKITSSRLNDSQNLRASAQNETQSPSPRKFTPR